MALRLGFAERAGEEASESEAGSWIRWRLGARVVDALDWAVDESFSQGSVRAMSVAEESKGRAHVHSRLSFDPALPKREI